MRKLRLPAFGRQVVTARRCASPRVVHVIYSDEWDRGMCELDCGDSHLFLQVRPREYAPATFDWYLVAGVRVAVFDYREDPIKEAKKFYALLGELGEYAAHVDIYRVLWQPIDPAKQGKPEFIGSAHKIAAALVGTTGQWPSWWSSERERVNAARRDEWLEHENYEVCSARST